MKANIFITDSDFSTTDKTFEYLLGFQPTFWWIILLKDIIYILLDSRYIWNKNNINLENISNKTWVNSIEFIEFESWSKWLLDKILELTNDCNKLILENNIASKYYKYLKTNSNKKIELNENYFWKQRIIKQQNEIENIKKAIEIIDNAFLEIQKQANSWELIWKTENYVRSLIINEIFENWWSGESFDSIVAFWKNSAIPHHNTWDTIIWNWPLLLDIWAIYNWYCSDFTRTIWVWEKNDSYIEFEKIYKIVKEAHLKAFNNTKALFLWQDIDKLARDYITNKWYWEYFSHWLWHWVWLDIHENPRINPMSKDIIENGMVFTIEPWIYLENKFWVRLEDIVFVENDVLKKHTKILF